MDNQKNTAPVMLDEEKLLKAIFEDDAKVDEAYEKAAGWLLERGQMLTAQTIIDAVEVAQGLITNDFEKWDEMKDDEKNDLSEILCGLIVARDLVADILSLPTKGRIEKVEAEDGGED